MREGSAAGRRSGRRRRWGLGKAGRSISTGTGVERQLRSGTEVRRPGTEVFRPGMEEFRPGMEVGRRFGTRAAVEQRLGRSSRGQRGFSAIELLATLGVAAVLAGLAVPGFAAFRRVAGVSSAANELIWALHLARSSAILRGQPVTVCLSRDERTCLQTPEAPATGWLVFQAAGQAVAVQAAPAGPVLHRFRLPEAVAVQGTRPAVTFWPVSRAGSTSTFEICDLARRAPGRSIVVSQMGRPRVAAEAASCAD